MTLSGESYSRDDALRDLRAIRERQGTDGKGFPVKIREDDHWEADAILLRLIDDVEIATAFDQVGKWYA